MRILTGMTSSAVPNNIIVLSSECSGSFSLQQNWMVKYRTASHQDTGNNWRKTGGAGGQRKKSLIHREYSVLNYEIMQDRWEHNLTDSIINPRKASFPSISWNITRHLCPELSSSDTLVLRISELYFYFNPNCSSMEINSKRKINWRNTEFIFQLVSCWNTTCLSLLQPRWILLLVNYESRAVTMDDTIGLDHDLRFHQWSERSPTACQL